MVVLEYELTKNEEIEVQEYLLSIKNCPSLSYTELNNLLKNLTSENQQIFIEGFLRTVVNYAIKVYCELKEHFVFPYSITDFIQSGNEVLVRFVNEKKYDNYHDFIWAFNIALRRNIIKNHLPISGNIIDKYLEFLDKRDEFFKKYHRNPSDDEMINIYGYGKKGIGYLNNYMYQNQVLKKSLNEDLLTNGCDYIGNLVENLFLRDTLLEILKDLNLKKHYYDTANHRHPRTKYTVLRQVQFLYS